MPDHTAILSQRWTDILPPNPPAPIEWWLLFSAVALLCLVVLAVAILWQTRPRQRALRVLRQCQRQLQAHSADTRVIAHRIYQAVLQGLAIHPAKVSPAGHDQRWRDFLQRLQVCVFASHTPAREDVADLIRQGRYWIKHDAKNQIVMSGQVLQSTGSRRR